MNSRSVPSPRSQFDWRFWVGALLTLACLVWLIVAMDWPAVFSALARVDLRWALLATGINLGSVFARALRWRTLFGEQPAPNWRRLAAALLVGQAGNVLLPARLGDIARASIASSGDAPLVLGTIVAEVSLDLLMLASLTVFLLAQVSLPRWWRVPGQVTVLSAVAAILLLALLVANRRRLASLIDRWSGRDQQRLVGRMLGLANRFLEGLSGLTLPTLARGLTYSGLVWLLYAAVNTTLLAAIGQQPSVLAGLFVLAVLLVGVAVPTSPGRIGVFHYLCVQALTVFGLDQATALSYAMVLHLISVVIPALLGVLLAWSLGVPLRLPRPSSKAAS